VHTTNDRASMQFDLQIPQALPNLKGSTTQWHTYQITFPANVQIPPQLYIGDVLDPKLVCTINGKQLKCSLTTASQITIQD